MQYTEPVERQWYLAAKALSDSLTEIEQSEWKVFLQDEKFHHDFSTLKKHWDQIGGIPYFDINKDEDWQKVLTKIRQDEHATRRVVVPSIWRYAAVIAGIIMLSIATWKVGFDRGEEVVATTIQAPKGARTYVILPDSSTVWLNAESKISFDPQFGKDNRNIALEGEAYFDVKKEEVPFNIHTPDIDIAVLGTAFNVKAYHNDGVISTALVRGSLKVSRSIGQGKTESVTLRPGEKVSLHGYPGIRSSRSFDVERNIDAAAEADWKDGWLTIRGESLRDLSKKIERLYNVKVRFGYEKLQDYRYTGRIQQLSLEQVLYALSLTSPVSYKINEKQVTLDLDQSKASKYKMN